jgi:carboxypeptidase Taq
MQTAQLRGVLGELREGLVPLVEAIAAARASGDGPEPLAGPFPVAVQRELLLAVLHEIGFDDERFRLDTSAHPFSSGTSPGDRRITTRYEEDTLEALFSGLHEFGHALYGAQIDPVLLRTPLCHGVSMGVHESQSRMWENMVGRGRPFCQFVLPSLRESFLERFANVDAADLYRAVNAVRPSLIRVRADEVTYNLHIVLRFELELGLFEGTLQPEQLPDEWNARMHSYFGLEVPSDSEGVLQDIHWSGGAFGYFPTYALGNIIAAQLWERLRADLPQLDEQIAAGEFAPLREWLREHVHRYGRMYTPAETLRRAIGAEIDPQPLLDYLWEKHAEVHGVRRPA